MALKDERSVFRLVEWLEGELERNAPMYELRDELAERVAWANIWFKNEEANTRLRALDCYSR